MTGPIVQKIQSHPKYQELRAKRNPLGVTLTILMLIVYYGYVGLIAFDKEPAGARGRVNFLEKPPLVRIFKMVNRQGRDHQIVGGRGIELQVILHGVRDARVALKAQLRLGEHGLGEVGQMNAGLGIGRSDHAGKQPGAGAEIKHLRGDRRLR